MDAGHRVPFYQAQNCVKCLWLWRVDWLWLKLMEMVKGEQSTVIDGPTFCIQSQTRSLTPYASSLQGGVSDEVTLSAYITAAFLEMNMYIDMS